MEQCAIKAKLREFNYILEIEMESKSCILCFPGEDLNDSALTALFLRARQTDYLTQWLRHLLGQLESQVKVHNIWFWQATLPYMKDFHLQVSVSEKLTVHFGALRSTHLFLYLYKQERLNQYGVCICQIKQKQRNKIIIIIKTFHRISFLTINLVG